MVASTRAKRIAESQRCAAHAHTATKHLTMTWPEHGARSALAPLCAHYAAIAIVLTAVETLSPRPYSALQCSPLAPL